MSIREPIQGQLNGKEPIQMQLFALSSDTEIMHELGNNTSMVGDFPIKFSIYNQIMNRRLEKFCVIAEF